MIRHSLKTKLMGMRAELSALHASLLLNPDHPDLLAKIQKMEERIRQVEESQSKGLGSEPTWQ